MVVAAELSTGRVLTLAAIAGATIFLGLPLGRIRRPLPRMRAPLNAGAIGILIFLLYDVLPHASEPVEAALTAANDASGTWLRFVGLAAVFAGGVALGLLGLVYYDRTARRRGLGSGWSPARRLALAIAVGIGLHNLLEGLAIGQSAAKGHTQRSEQTVRQGMTLI